MTITFDIDDAFLRDCARKAVEEEVRRYFNIGGRYSRSAVEKELAGAVRAAAGAMDMAPIIDRVLTEEAEKAIRAAAVYDLTKRAKGVYKRHAEAQLIPPDPENVEREILGGGK